MADDHTILDFPFPAPYSVEIDPTYARLRSSSPVTRVRLPSGDLVWLVTRYDDVKFVHQDPRFSRALASRPGAPALVPGLSVPTMLLCMDPPEHSRIRRLLGKAFTSRRVEQLRPAVQATVDRLVAAMIEQGSPADLIGGLAEPLPLTIITEMLGVPDPDRELFGRAINGNLKVRGGPDADNDAPRLSRYLAELIDVKRRSPADDVLSAMIQATDDGNRLSEAELISNAALLILGGFDSTKSVLGNSVVALLRRRSQLDLLLADGGLMDNAVEELLRYSPAAISGLVRIAAEDVTIAGVAIPAGDAVLCVEASANRDDRVFGDADRLDITRSSASSHMSFGYGPHYCLGAALARLELTTALRAVLTSMPGLTLAVPEDELVWEPDIFVRTLKSLPVAWDR
jgi:cytochrome P450